MVLYDTDSTGEAGEVVLNTYQSKQKSYSSTDDTVILNLPF